MKFTDLPVQDRADIINRVSSTLKVQNAIIVEKDWWVTQILRALFSLPYAEHISFKGGTSLSKCWHLIDRFSEDVDIAINREYLGFSGKLSKSQISDKLRRVACSFVREKLQADVKERLMLQGVKEEHFNVNVIITPITTTDPETINVEYQPVIQNIALTGDNYILPKIKIEVSGRSMSEPIEDVMINSLIDQVYTVAPFKEEMFGVRAVMPTRTFLEKVFLLHEEFAKPTATIRIDRMSRHLYDVAEMLNTPIAQAAIEDEKLYRSVIEHRKSFIGLRGFDYDTLFPKTISILPPTQVKTLWAKDYDKMRSMIYRETPEYESILSSIKNLQEKINQLPYKPL